MQHTSRSGCVWAAFNRAPSGGERVGTTAARRVRRVSRCAGWRSATAHRPEQTASAIRRARWQHWPGQCRQPPVRARRRRSAPRYTCAVLTACSRLLRTAALRSVTSFLEKSSRSSTCTRALSGTGAATSISVSLCCNCQPLAVGRNRSAICFSLGPACPVTRQSTAPGVVCSAAGRQPTRAVKRGRNSSPITSSPWLGLPAASFCIAVSSAAWACASEGAAAAALAPLAASSSAVARTICGV